MGIVEFTLMILALFVMIVKYQMSIQEAALMERYHLVEKIKKIMDSRELEDREYSFLVSIMKISSDPLFIPKVVMYALFYKNSSKGLDKPLGDLFDEIKKEFFAVNFIAGLHWYAFGGLILASFVLTAFIILLPFIAFSKARKAFKLLYGIENRAQGSFLYPYAIARMA